MRSWGRERFGGKRRKRGKRNTEKKEKRNTRILFWNVAGVLNKDREFWKFLESMDMVNLTETWLDEKGWDRIKGQMNKNFEWKAVHAEKEKGIRKGRAKGGIIIGVKKEMIEKGKELNGEWRTGFVSNDLLIEGRKTKIITIYNQENIAEGIENLREIEEEEMLILGGDFNVRTGELGRFICEKEEEGIKERKSKDGESNIEGKRLIEIVEEKGWYILNGTKEGDEDGEFTFIGGRGNTVIDYGIVNRLGWERVEKFEVIDKVDSDHAPICITLKGKGLENEERVGKRKKKIISWSEEDRVNYLVNLREWDEEENETGTVQEEWDKLKKGIHAALIKKEIKIRKWKLGFRKWWDKECAKEKREVKKKLRLWKEGKGTYEDYRKERKKWKELCREKERGIKEEEEAQLRGIKNETEAWKFINKYRKKRETVENSIGKHEWLEHFRNLLEGSSERKVGEERKVEEEKIELEDTEIRKAIKNAKRKKAGGIDEITNEAWIFGEEIIEKRLGKIMKRVWNGEGVPEDWKMAVIVPLYKKGNKEETKNYRGISLLATAYKVYTEVLRERLVKEMEEKNILPEGQAGFRKKRSTIDNIYILNHIVQKAKIEKRKVYSIFVDLKAAFDTVNREKLWKVMEEVGISEGLIERIKELYKETKSNVRTEEGNTEEFWTTKGVRQGCLLSPALFCIYIAGLEKELEKRFIGGVKVGRCRVWSLAYADDMVLLAEGREALEDMIGTMRKFFKKRDLILSTEKTKVMVFGKKKKEKKEKWMWEGKEMEEVKEFKYLGFIFERNGGYEKHLKELRNKGLCASRKVWGLGEKICSGDIRRRKRLFSYLVGSVMAYGVEIWGWKEREGLEKIQENHFRWILGLDYCTPRYLVRKELNVNKMREKWSMRALKYEERIRKLGEERLVKICWMEKQNMKEKEIYSKEREEYLNGRGWSSLGFELERSRGRNMYTELEKRGKDIEWQEIEGRIRESKYNGRYSRKNEEELPEYTRNCRSGTEIKTKARLRCGNLEIGNKYWLEEGKRKCELCGDGMGRMEHYILECEKTRKWFEGIEGFAHEIIRKAIGEERNKEITDVWTKVDRELSKKKRELKEKENEKRKEERKVDSKRKGKEKVGKRKRK